MSQRSKTTAQAGLSPAAASPHAATPHAASAEPAESAPQAPPRDVVLVGGPTADQKGLRVLRARQTSDRGTALELGEVRPLEEGKPLRGDVVRLRPRNDMPALYDVETEFAAPQQSDVAALPRTRTGPAQVATESYRANWDAIWPQRADTGKSGPN